MRVSAEVESGIRFGSVLSRGRSFAVLVAVALFSLGARGAESTIQTKDYDNDDDGLIEVSNLEQLNAIRWDLDGDGSPSDTAYDSAYPDAISGMGCPVSGCLGYELVADLDFDANGDGEPDEGDAYWNNGAGWLPIGHTSEGFWATFDGNGHTISNLSILRGSAQRPSSATRPGNRRFPDV